MSLTLTHLRLIDQACERFEDAARAGARPDLVAFLADVPDQARETLQRELLAIQAELNGQAKPGEDGGQGADAFLRAGFKLLGRLGRGGMGTVYRARQLDPDRLVAVKVISANDADPDVMARFRVEAEAAARLQHPNIVRVFEVCEVAGRPCIVLELVEGGTLADRLKAGPIPTPAAAQLVATLARAVQHANDHGVVHRDLKPANVLMGAGHPSPESPWSMTELKITDFGLAKRLDVSGATQSGAILGTPGYMAPEQARPLAKVGPLVDVYGLGAVLYECLTGRPPFQAGEPLATLLQVLADEPTPPRSVRPDLPADLEVVCLRCLAKDPTKRYPSADAVAEDLDRFASGRRILAKPAGLAERLAKWAQRRPSTTTAIVLFAAVAAIGFPLVTVLWLQALSDRAAAVSSRTKAEKSAYYSQVGQADLHLRLGDIVRARLSLDRCVPSGAETDLRGWEWHYLDTQSRPAMRWFDGHKRPLQAVAVSPDGHRVATGGGVLNTGHVSGQEPGELIVWESDTGAVIRDLGGAIPAVQTVAFSPDGRRLAAAAAGSKSGQPGGVYIWDLETDQPPARVAELTQQLESWQLAFDPTGLRLAIQSGRSLILVPTAGGPAVTLVDIVGFGFAGGDLFTFAITGGVQVRDPLTGTVRRGAGGAFNPLARPVITPDGRWLAYVQPDLETVAIAPADRPANPARVLRGHAGDVVCLAIGPDGMSVATGGADGTVRVWDRSSGQERLIFRGHVGRVASLAFAPDASRLYSVALDGTANVWDLTRPPEYLPLKGPTRADGRTQRVEDITIRNDGTVLAARLRDGEIVRWKLPGGVLTDTRPLPATPELTVPGRRLAFDTAGRRLAGVSSRSLDSLVVWDVESDAELFAVATRKPVRRVIFSPDGNQVSATIAGKGDDTGEVVVWDVENKQERFRTACAGITNGPVIALHERRCAVVATPVSGRNAHVELWDIISNRLVHVFRMTAIPVALTFDGSGGRLVAVTEAGELTLWDTERGQTLATFHVPPWVGDLAFSPDGRRLATATREAVTLWDSATGQEVITIRGRPRTRFDPPFNPRVVFSPNGQTIAANVWDDTVAVWSADRSDSAAASGRVKPWHITQAMAALDAGDPVSTRFHTDRIRGWQTNGTWALERGHLLAHLSEWQPASADFAGGFAKQPPDNPWLWFEYALVLVHTGELAKYRNLCMQMVARFGPDRPFDTRRAVAFTCCLAPAALQDVPAVIQLPKEELAQIPHSAPARLALGFALYRAGKFREAAECCRQVAGAPNEESIRAVAALVRGLALRKEGQASESERSLVEAVSRAGTDRIMNSADWYYWSLYQILMRELEHFENISSAFCWVRS